MNALKDIFAAAAGQAMVCAVVGSVVVAVVVTAVKGAGEGKAGAFSAGQQACRLLVFAACMA